MFCFLLAGPSHSFYPATSVLTRPSEDSPDFEEDYTSSEPLTQERVLQGRLHIELLRTSSFNSLNPTPSLIGQKRLKMTLQKQKKQARKQKKNTPTRAWANPNNKILNLIVTAQPQPDDVILERSLIVA